MFYCVVTAIMVANNIFNVYIIRDKRDEIIYIGKAKRLRTRVSQYFREGVPHDAKVTR